MDFEHPSAETSQESEPQRETIRKEYEYRDAEGGLIGKAVLELGAEERPVPPRFARFEPTGDERVRVLKSFVLIGQKDGQPTEFDVLKLTNPHDVEILVETERGSGMHAYDDAYGQGSVCVPPLENPIDVGVALHELGHADQHRDERFGIIKQMYSWKWGMYNQMNDLKQTLRAVPEAAELFDSEELAQLYKLEERYEKAEDKQERAQLLDAWHEMMKLMEIDKVMCVPRNIMERDATRRAFQWLRSIREKTGIDLLSKDVKVHPSVSSGVGERCEDSVVSEDPELRDWTTARVISNTIESLKGSLSTYSAMKFRKKKPGKEDDIGIMPAAGGKRKT